MTIIPSPFRPTPPCTAASVSRETNHSSRTALPSLSADFPLITFENWTPIDERTIEITPRPAADGSAGPGIRVTVSARGENGTPVPGRFAEQTVGKGDRMTPKKPKRIAWETELAEGRTLTVVTTIE